MHVVPNNVARCRVGMLQAFAQAFKTWERPLSWPANPQFQFPSVAQKLGLLKLSNVHSHEETTLY